MININQIPYNDCDTPKNYSKDIDSCDTLEKLKEKIDYWKPLAQDAHKIVHSMTKARFQKFRIAIKKERKGIYSENEDAMTILMPMPMFEVSKVAIHCKAPFGCALHRMIDSGYFKEKI